MASVGKYVFQQREALSEKERLEFLENLSLFTRNNTLKRLAVLVFKEAKKKRGEWRGPKGEELDTWLWKGLNKKGPYKRNTLSTDFNRLKDVVDHYFAFLHLKRSTTEMKLTALKEYVQRGRSNLVSGQITSTRKSVSNPDLASYFKQVELDILEAEYRIDASRRKNNKKFLAFTENLQAATENLNSAWILGGSMLENAQVHASLLLNVPVIDEVSLAETDLPAPLLYRRITRVMRDWIANGRQPTGGALAELEEIHRMQQEFDEQVSPKDSFQIHSLLISLTITLSIRGIKGANDLFFRTVRWGNEKGYLDENGKMNVETFQAICNVALRNGEMDLVEEMMGQYGQLDKLLLKDAQGFDDEESISMILDLVRARWHLEMGEYRKVLKLVSKGGLEDALFDYSQRWLETQALYYLEDYDLCMTRIIAFETMLRNNAGKDVLVHPDLYKKWIGHFKHLVLAIQEIGEKRQKRLQKLQHTLEEGGDFTGRGKLLAEIEKFLDKK